MNALLGRPEIRIPLPVLHGRRILVTGAHGYIGTRVCELLEEHGAKVGRMDVPAWNVLDLETVQDWASHYPDGCIHLAAHKEAPYGEDHPEPVADLNIRGTANIINTYRHRAVVASTCKAASPLTVYGASKLIAERIALNAEARVVRYVNVANSSRSVLEHWAQIPADDPIPVTHCFRMWMTLLEAATLTIAALDYPAGRYAINAKSPRSMHSVARLLYPHRQIVEIAARRGDRMVERLIGESEHEESYAPGVIRITHPADHAHTAQPLQLAA